MIEIAPFRHVTNNGVEVGKTDRISRILPCLPLIVATMIDASFLIFLTISAADIRSPVVMMSTTAEFLKFKVSYYVCLLPVLVEFFQILLSLFIIHLEIVILVVLPTL